MAALDDILLQLYRAAREQPVAAFQDAALALARPLLQFESAIWGSGRLTHPGIAPRHMHLHQIDPQGAVEWKQINRVDKVIDIVDARRGRAVQFHAPTLFAAREDAVMRDYARRYGRQSYLITAFGNQRPGVFSWMSMYRPDLDNRFTEAQRELCEVLMSHFEQALLINEACCTGRALAGVEAEASSSLALALPDGAIFFAQAAFICLLIEEWPQADDQVLPRPLIGTLLGTKAGTFLGRSIRCESRTAGDLTLLRARRRLAIDRLTPRQYEIAQMFCRGFSYKAIARQLGISPATVRNHVSAIYVELGITSKDELAASAHAKRGR